MNENDVVIKQCNEVRVYLDQNGYVCIWQYAADTDTQTICIPPEHADALAKAIVRASADASDAAGA